jgi:hypothetical protein
VTLLAGAVVAPSPPPPSGTTPNVQEPPFVQEQLLPLHWHPVPTHVALDVTVVTEPESESGGGCPVVDVVVG